MGTIQRLGLQSTLADTTAAADIIVLDRKTLLDRVNGDLDLLGEIADRFLREHGSLMMRARTAIHGDDPEALDYALHTMRGMFGALAADSARAVTEQLQSLAEAGDRDEVAATFTVLERQVGALCTQLAGFAHAAAA